ncbi:MAG: MFS transporter [Trueperaceae bacterium]|nr:MFS transporter [Trueperaceae bacterium]
MRRERAARPFVIFCTAVAVVSTSKGMLTPLVPLYALQLDASPALVGLLVSSGFWLPSLLALAVGVTVDRLGPRLPLLIGTATIVVAPLAVALFGTIAALAVAQVVLGLAQLLVVLAAQSSVGREPDPRLRLRDYGWYSGFQSGGKFAGPLVAGLVADGFGFPAAFATAGAVSALSLATFLFTARAEPVVGPGAPAQTPMGGELTRLLGLGGIRMALLSSCAVVFALAMVTTFMPLRLSELAFSATAIGALFSLKAFAGMLVRPALRFVVERHGGSRARTLTTMTLLLALGVALLAVFDTFALLAFAVVLAGFGSGITQPLSLALVADHADAGRRGLAIGVRLTANRVAQVVSPLLMGGVAEAVGVRAVFPVGAAVLVFVAWSIARWRGRSGVEVGAGG